MVRPVVGGKENPAAERKENPVVEEDKANPGVLGIAVARIRGEGANR